MKNLEALLGDVLEARTGLRHPPYPEKGKETPFQRRCITVALSIAANRDRLLAFLPELQEVFRDTILVGDNHTATGIDLLLRTFVQLTTEEVPQAERELILRFLKPAIDAVCVVAFALNNGSSPMPPDDFERKKDAVATASELLAGYPDEIAGGVKRRLGRALTQAMVGDDVSDRFRRETVEALTSPRFYPREENNPQLRRSCPAHPGVFLFASTVMDLFLTVYRERYERLKDGNGVIPPDTLERLLEDSFDDAFPDGDFRP